MHPNLATIGSLLVFAALVAVAATAGAMFSPGPWYATIIKPGWTPPNWLFGPVWTTLYVMIAIAGWLVWTRGPRWPALGFWSGGLLLNAMWSWLFFGRQNIGLALVDIAVMWLSIVLFLVVTRQANRSAFWLFVPYFVWVSYAAALNLRIWTLNP
ncbi:MAG: TspO/MBR family protein [Hyphomicrobiaceae bacterium]